MGWERLTLGTYSVMEIFSIHLNQQLVFNFQDGDFGLQSNPKITDYSQHVSGTFQEI